MKILRKGDDFRKMPEKSVQDVLIVKNLLNQGWKYCSKQEYRDAQGFEKTIKQTDDAPVKTTKASNKKSKK
jgi:hypothetical protein